MKPSASPKLTPEERNAIKAMPRTIKLLKDYPEGAEREKAFLLVCAAIEEGTTHLLDAHRRQIDRLVAQLVARDPLTEYLGIEKKK